ncbi:MAG: hypothetical protein ACE5NP_06375 [Anaerolineae bacterium]
MEVVKCSLGSKRIPRPIHFTLTLLDVGHPLVRRLIEEVKQSAFRVEGNREGCPYGRTTYMVTLDVEEVTVLFRRQEHVFWTTRPLALNTGLRYNRGGISEILSWRMSYDDDDGPDPT